MVLTVEMEKRVLVHMISSSYIIFGLSSSLSEQFDNTTLLTFNALEVNLGLSIWQSNLVKYDQSDADRALCRHRIKDFVKYFTFISKALIL